MSEEVAYATWHGATAGIAKRIAETLTDSGPPAAARPVEEVTSVAWYDAVVLGGAALMFHGLKPAVKFARTHREALASRLLWLFSSGPLGTDLVGRDGKDVLQASRPKEFDELTEMLCPRGEQIFFGAYDPDADPVGPGERIVRHMPAARDTMPDGDFRDWAAIDSWARGIAEAIGADDGHPHVTVGVPARSVRHRRRVTCFMGEDVDMSALSGWTRGSHSAGGVTHPTYRKGVGPGVVLIHEVPGITPEVLRFADEVVDRGYTVVMPHLFGDPGAPATTPQIIKAIARVCVSNEFTKLKAGITSPVADWLRSLARSLHSELGGPGVGAIGMCLTGGFALAMMVDDSIAAPVVAQPSLPAAIGKARAGDLGLSPADRATVRRRVAEGCPVLGVRYRDDPATGTRFDTLTTEFGDGFIKIELEGKGHATLTADRQQVAVDRVLDFFDERLKAD